MTFRQISGRERVIPAATFYKKQTREKEKGFATPEWTESVWTHLKACDGRYKSDDGQLKCYFKFNDMLNRECRLFEFLVSTWKHYSTVAWF